MKQVLDRGLLDEEGNWNTDNPVRKVDEPTITMTLMEEGPWETEWV